MHLVLLDGSNQVTVQKLSTPNVSLTEFHDFITWLAASGTFYEATIMVFSENVVCGFVFFFFF